MPLIKPGTGGFWDCPRQVKSCHKLPSFFKKQTFFFSSSLEQTTRLIRRLKIDLRVADFRRLLHKDARTTGSEAVRCVSAFHHTPLCSEGFRLSWKTHQCSTLFSFIFLFLSFLLTPNLIPHLCLCLAFLSKIVSQAGLTGSEHNVLAHERDNTDRKGRALRSRWTGSRLYCLV